MQDHLRFIRKEEGRWKVYHSDGHRTYHKTLKAAKAYEHTLQVVDPFPEDKMSVPETEGSNEDKFNLMYDEAMIDLDLANVSHGEREVLATQLAKMRWEEQQQC